MKAVRLSVFGFIFIVLGLAAVRADELATVTGYLTDPSGASVPHASVKLTKLDTNVTYSGEANESGLFRISGLPVGLYRMQIQRDGFKTITEQDIELHVQDVLSMNFQLQLGSPAETVTVHGGGVNINTTDGTVSTLVDQSYVQNMPLNGRSFQDLILLTPGVTTNSTQLNGPSLGRSGEFSVNGQRTESNYYTVDGVSANLGQPGGSSSASIPSISGSIGAATALGTTQALVPVDDLQEFRVQSSSYSAEYGRNPGGQFAMETKSGTNQWHGDAFDYIRNNDLGQANDYFYNFDNLPKTTGDYSTPPLRQNDFGGTVGGPVRIPHTYNGRDKTFFFVSYEGLRVITPSATAPEYVPDYCMRGLIGPGQTSVCQGDLNSNGVQRKPAAAVLLPIVKAFPLPNYNPIFDTVNGVGQAIGSWSNSAFVNSGGIRLDQIVNDKTTLFLRLSYTNSGIDTRLTNEYNAVTTTPFLTRTYTAGMNNIISSLVSNELRFNYSSSGSQPGQVLTAFGGSSPINSNGSYNLATYLGLQPSWASELNFISPSNDQWVLQQVFTSNQIKQWNIVDAVSYAMGAHQFKFGIDYRRLESFNFPDGVAVNYQFSQSAMGPTQSGESFIENGEANLHTTSINNSSYPLFTNFSAFAQDNWKVSHRVTLSLGLRWEVNPAPTASQGPIPATLVGTNANNYAVAPYGSAPLYQTTWFNFAPRFGVAYQLRTTPGWETVVRGGAGVFYDTGQQVGGLAFEGPWYNASSPVQFNAPVTTSAPVLPTIAIPPMAPTGTQLSFLYGFDPHLQLPYTLQWNVSVEQSLGKSQALTVSYVGSHGARLLEERLAEPTATPANSNFGVVSSFTLAENGLTSDYDALQLQYQRRLSRGLTVLGSYTWSHCLDYGSVNYQVGYQRGDCDFDIRQNVSAAFSYDLPDVKGNGVIRAIRNHWGIDDRFTARTAMPVFLKGNTVYDTATGIFENTSYDTVLGSNGQPLPAYIYGAACNSFYEQNTVKVLTLPGQVCPGGRAINPCAFISINASGLPGSPNKGCPTLASSGETVGGLAPRNAQRGFDMVQMDVAIRREFPIYERLKLQFRAEAFNVFNHPDFGVISTTGTSFGVATKTVANSLGVMASQYQMGGPRVMQFALKLIF